ncbi:MAG: transposase family protein, partial [Candidatus Microthrix parvicella]
MLALPALTVTKVTVGNSTVILDIRYTRQLLRCPCGWSTRAVHSRSTRRWRHLDCFGMKTVLQGEIRRLSCRA